MNSFLRIGALVEIVAGADGSVSERLLALAYRASELDFVVLALRGTDARTVDRTLDRVVARYGIRANGVVYADAGDAASILSFARRARVVIANSPELQAELVVAGIPYFNQDEAVQALEGFERSRRRSDRAASRPAEIPSAPSTI
jgi:hypothetical protein